MPQTKTRGFEITLSPTATQEARIVVDGLDVTDTVVSCQIRAGVGERTTAVLEVVVVEVTALGDVDPSWIGLESLPAKVLRDELARREG